VNRGRFVELEAELSDEEGHLHGDGNEEDDDSDDDGADLVDLIDKRRLKESDTDAKRRATFHQDLMHQQEEEDLEKFIEAVETGFRKKRKGIAGEDDEGNDRDARRRRAEGLTDLEVDYEGLGRRIFDAKMLKEEDYSDGEVEMIEAAYKRRNQRLAEKRQKEEERNSDLSPEKLISDEALASIVSNKENHMAVKAPLSKKIFIPRNANAKRAVTEEELAVEAKAKSSLMGLVQAQSRNRGRVAKNHRTFVFAQRKEGDTNSSKEKQGNNSSAGAAGKTTMPQKMDNLLRSSSLVKLLKNNKTSKGGNRADIFGTQASTALSKLLR
jgi:hypothetical protein